MANYLKLCHAKIGKTGLGSAYPIQPRSTRLMLRKPTVENTMAPTRQKVRMVFEASDAEGENLCHLQILPLLKRS